MDERKLPLQAGDWMRTDDGNQLVRLSNIHSVFLGPRCVGSPQRVYIEDAAGHCWPVTEESTDNAQLRRIAEGIVLAMGGRVIDRAEIRP